ncbi:MAG TPA: thioredoxin family protein [Pseudogracilibacillus sp.]|nr:thioredoxin family protein [Pseudogracilibacillus sp.]
MKNKMLLILVAIVILFVGLIVVNNMKNKKAVSENNPYGKETLHQETIDQLNDPLYDNIILPEELDEKLENGEDVTVYYYSPTCVYCQRTTPMVVPIAEELDIDLKKMNLLEFDLMNYYDVEGTPSIIHYENGEEVDRLVGQPENEEEVYEFFDTVVN